MSTQAERKARRERYKNATPEQKSNYAKYQRENFKNIAASFSRVVAEEIAATYRAAGITPAQAMRAAAEYLTAGGTSAAEKIKTAAAAYAERLHHQPAPADTTGTTPDDPTTEEQE